MDERTPLPPGEHPEETFNPIIDDFEPKPRSYLHFDLPPKNSSIHKLVGNVRKVSKHAFYPFLGFTAKERRYKRVDGKRQIKVKDRNIRYASHRDSAIYEYYSSILSHSYESFLKNEQLSEVVLAYRSGIGSNIDHAANLFDEISSRGDCTCIGLDVSGFFDNLLHQTLKEAWCNMLGVEKLPSDHFAIFKSLTNYSWVEKNALEERLGRKLNANQNGLICSTREFHEKVRGTKPSIIETHKSDAGIPQGSALSGLLANIYLFEVDGKILKICKSAGGSYRRYSDDIAVILPPGVDIASYIEMIRKLFLTVGLSLNDSKTEIVIFRKNGNDLRGDRPFQYLGFTFDGKRKLIRDSSLNRYYKKMTRAVRAARINAEKKNIGLDSVYLRRHYKMYTHKGKGRNFVRYAFRAANKLKAPEIRRQLRRHTRNFAKRLQELRG